MNSRMIVFVLFYCVLASTSGKSIAKDDEVEVRLQFFEYELEEYCVAKNEAEWKFLNGTDADLKKILDIELKEAEDYKKELEITQKHIGNKFSSQRMQRHMDIFSHMGAPLLGNSEFKEYIDYSVKLMEMMGTTQIVVPSKGSGKNSQDSPAKINQNQINQILYTEEVNADRLKTIWVSWFEELRKMNNKTKYDFVQQLSILDLEAEQNGEEELSDYWLKMSDLTWINYESAETLWNELVPLYNKLKHFMISLAIRNFGTDELQDNKLIPTHLLGSLESWDWVTAAEKLGAFNHLDAYQDLKSWLTDKNTEELYKMADNMTVEFGSLPQSFYAESRFNEIGGHCRNKLTDYCEREHVMRVMACRNDNQKLSDLLRAVKNTMKMKYLHVCGREEEENGFLMREGPRYSVLYESLQGLTALKVLQPQNLRNHNLFKSESEEKQKLLSLITTALDVIAPLPYYLVSDLWRLNALKEIDSIVSESDGETTTASLASDAYNGLGATVANESYDSTKSYDSVNLTSDWWKYRNRYQGVSSPDGKAYEDYLQDPNIVWSKPLISKFVGALLQFQILEYFDTENSSNYNAELMAIMRKGKSQSWEYMVREAFNITAISVKPLLRYFKPLEEFLDKGIKFKNETQIFTTDDFNFVPQSYSSGNISREGKKQSEGSDTLYFSFIVIAAVGVVAVIVTIGRRRYRKRQRAIERKRRLTDL
ncbi:hypothetical protein RUM43_000600 [Polyplax serrata]|uniref:Angiotensin-converting enzyme n=1 Tax=Polyplax serrata TaxID=468196 RepID=A0AAN8XNC2_POLSC